MDVRRAWGVVVAGVLAGCSSPAPGPADTGARQAVEQYYQALAARDWQRAYAALPPDSRARLRPEQFAALAQGYRAGLGFEPEAVHVRSCEERGEEATAHVVLTGHAGPARKQFKDAAALRRGPAGWGVVLPSRFGRVPPR